jgi:YVTN family beta-propeller protein
MRRRTIFLLFAMVALARAAEPARLLVLHKAASTLGFYTPEGKLLAQVAVGRHPHEMALSRDGRFVYITDNGTMRIEDAGQGGNTVSVVDVKTRKRIATISLGKFHRPHGLDLDAQSGRLLVTTENPDRLLLIDLASRSVLRTYDTGGKTAHMVVWGAGSALRLCQQCGLGDGRGDPAGQRRGQDDPRRPAARKQRPLSRRPLDLRGESRVAPNHDSGPGSQRGRRRDSHRTRAGARGRHARWPDSRLRTNP